jgi:hypothetical protein
MLSGFGFLAMGPVTLEARQTLTTLEAIRPDRGWRSCDRAALHGELVGRDLPGSWTFRAVKDAAARLAALGPSGHP